MNTPLVLNACPLDSEYINTKTENINPPKKNISKDVENIKNIIENIHKNSKPENSKGVELNLGEYEPHNPQSSKFIDDTIVKKNEPDYDAYSLEYNKNNVISTPEVFNQTVSNNIKNPYQDELVQKVNYLIYLLDQQKETKGTQTVEELLLYTFIGVFIIFVLDSFTKIGSKYRR